MNQTHQVQPTLRLRDPEPPTQSRSLDRQEASDETDDNEFVQYGSADTDHLTKMGMPDRRFKGQRDLPEESVINPAYRRPAQPFQDEEGIHRTRDGKPDRRFLENRAMPEDEAKVRQAEYFLAHRKQTQH